MKNKEPLETRLKRVKMHTYFVEKINAAMKSENYIAASWLIYSCLENRYYRTLEKYRENCRYCKLKSKCNTKKQNELALTTKIKCVQRLHENSVSCVKQSFRFGLFQETIDWVKERNMLMHELLSLEYYENTDELFRESAEIGKKLLDETYNSCTKFREAFFKEDYIFQFPEAAMEGCSCKPRKKEK